MHVQSIGKKGSLVLEIYIFKYFVNLSSKKVGHFEFDPDHTSQDSWEDCNKCMNASIGKKYSLVLEIFIRTDKSRTDGNTEGRTEPKSISATKFFQWGMIQEDIAIFTKIQQNYRKLFLQRSFSKHFFYYRCFQLNVNSND